MNSKTTWTLMLLAAILFAFIVLFERHQRQPGDLSMPPKMLPQLRPAATTSVRVRPAGKLEIRAERTNNTWRLTKPLGYPAEAEAVEGLLQALAQLSGQTRLTGQDLKAGSRSEKEFGLDPEAFSIVIEQPGYLGQLKIGGLTALKDQLFLQVVGTEGIFVVDAGLLRLIPHSADEWRSGALVNLREVAFDHVAVTNGGRVFELERVAASGLWRMIRPMEARADNPKIEDLLQKLQSLRVTRFVSDDPKADLEPFGLQSPELELGLALGTNLVCLIQSGKSSTNDASQVYVRRADPPGVVLVPAEPIAAWRAPDKDYFRDRRLVSLTPNLVTEIEIRGAESLLLQRLTNGVWQEPGTNGFVADPSLVEVLLGDLSTLEVAQFVKDVVTPLNLPTYGLQPPVRQVVLRSGTAGSPGGGTNRVVVELQFGATEANLVYVRRADENSVCAVKVRDFQRLPLDAWRLRDRRLWHFTENDVARLTVCHQGRTNELIRNGANQWTVPATAQGRVNELALDEAVHRLGELTAAAWLARGVGQRPLFGFTERSPLVTVELKNGAKWSVEFGGVSARGLPYAVTQVDGQECIFEFPWSIYQYLQTCLGLGSPGS